MPKATFFRLPTEKKDRLMRAAYLEFSRAPFNDASISHIIQDAGIPRGSFYQYFEDKADIFFYMLGNLRAEAAELLRRSLVVHEGDLFATAKDFATEIIDYVIASEHADLFKNVFLYMDFHAVSKMAGPPFQHHPGGAKDDAMMHELHDFILSHVAREQLRVQNDEELNLLMREIFGMIMQAFGFYFSRMARDQAVSKADLKTRTLQLIDWLQYGAADPKGGQHA